MKKVYFSPTHYSETQFNGATHTADVSIFRQLGEAATIMAELASEFYHYTRGYSEFIIFTIGDLMDFFAGHSSDAAHRSYLDAMENRYAYLLIDNITEL
jgi:hypothetical protein